MNDYTVYILQSESSGRLYIGYTSDFERRFEEHNAGQTKSTKNKGPWKTLFTKPVDSKESAVQLERKLKSWKNKSRILAWIERKREL